MPWGRNHKTGFAGPTTRTVFGYKEIHVFPRVWAQLSNRLGNYCQRASLISEFECYEPEKAVPACVYIRFRISKISGVICFVSALHLLPYDVVQSLMPLSWYVLLQQ
jgi:hypothetical protein